MAITNVYNNISIRGVTYNSGNSFVCASSQSGWSQSESGLGGHASQTLTAGQTYYIYQRADGSSVTHPYLVCSTSSANNAIGWYTESVFPYAKHTVSYNANGGTGAPASQTKTYGYVLTLHSTKPTRTGYTFVNWNTKADGSGRTYSVGSQYGEDVNITLYAQWSENTMTVYYCGNGADYGTYQGNSVDLNDIVHTDVFYYDNTYDTGLSNVQNKNYLYLSRTGYSPTGYWITAGNGYISVHEDDTSLNTGEAIANAFNMTLANTNQAVRVYAQWQKNNYTFHYNSNGGYGNIDSQIVKWEDTFYPSDNLFKREGYKFIGWNACRDDNKWIVNYQGWLTDEEIAAGGYEKRIYRSQEELIFNESWINGNENTREFTLYAVWEISGVVYIDNGTLFEPYLAYIDNGTDWDLYLMYVEDGTNWNIIS